MNILDLFQRKKEVKTILEDVKKDEFSHYVTGCSEHLQYLLTYATYLQSGSFVLYIAPNVYKANLAYEQLSKLAGYENVNLYLHDEIISSELLAVSQEFKQERNNTLKSIVLNEKKIIITHLLAVLKANINKEDYLQSIIHLNKGKEIDLKEFVTKAIKMGYKKVPITTQLGEISVRGEVIDIYPSCYSNPIRINLDFDNIEKIRIFDIQTQISKEEIEQIDIYPVNEIVIDNPQEIIEQIKKDSFDNEIVLKDLENLSNYENMEKINKYLPYICDNYQSIIDYIDDKIIIFDDFSRINDAYEKICLDINNYLEQTKLYSNKKVLFLLDFETIYSKKQIFCSEFKSFVGKIKLDNIYNFNGYDIINYDHNIKLLINELKENKFVTYVLLLETKEKYNLTLEILKENNISVNCKTNEIIEKGINIYHLDKIISFGFFDQLQVITEAELFPQEKKKMTKYRSVYQNVIRIQSKEDLSIGDYIVHYDYGIGKYQGIETVDLNGIKNDYLVLQFENMPIYMPVEKINLLEKYQGSEGVNIKLSKIGSKDWEKKKRVVSEKLENIAKELIELQIARETQNGFKYPKDSEFQKLFENDFPYVETPDQISIVEEVKKEMEKGRVIDRLICGDVGFGKTEIAMRIAFKTIYSGKQVAYLAPTTILTRQHYYTFKERFSKYGIKVGLLNRLVSEKEQNEIIKELKNGLIDIIIGTHRLLSEDVKFKDLGLLIVDEEQRFGVIHKEKIKKLKTNINVLTLTATPIPRTLQMSFMGVRELSLIETAPTDRHPIQTYVLEYNDAVVKEAIYRELGRGGQIFYLHNRISDLETVYRKLHKLVPEAKICVGHGQMAREKLEDTIQAFIDKQYDLLLCTTIIETGIDIPNSNTLIIDEADRLGLSQLYQIRGRVGRSDKIAYAYLTYRKNKVLSSIEEKRLFAIKEYTKLGSGYKIAFRDLAIRGAGDILGKEQSGYIDTVGLDMYMKMLNDSIKKVQGKEFLEEKNYNIEVSKHISSDYVSDDAIRIYIHKEISQIESEIDKTRIIDEFTDRFGKLSEEVLLYIEEKYLESLFKKYKIVNILENKYIVTIIIPEETLNNLKVEDIFLASTKVSSDFSFEYKNRQLIVKLKKEPNDKKWIYMFSKLFTLVGKKRV